MANSQNKDYEQNFNIFLVDGIVFVSLTKKSLQDISHHRENLTKNEKITQQLLLYVRLESLELHLSTLNRI